MVEFAFGTAISVLFVWFGVVIGAIPFVIAGTIMVSSAGG